MIALRALKRAWDPDGLLCPASPLGGTKGSRAFPESGTDTHDVPRFAVDEESELVQAPGSLGLSEIERRLRSLGRTLGLVGVPDMDLARFVALGMPGTRDHLADPVDQRLAGLVATLPSGERVVQRATPRRATGPDLAALFVGAEERVGRVESAVFPARRLDARPARALSFRGETGAPVSPAESAAFERVVRAFSGR
jgi:FAD/FMN-containing dehydrogenase